MTASSRSRAQMVYWLMADRLEPEVYRAAAVADEGCKTQEGSHLISVVDVSGRTWTSTGMQAYSLEGSAQSGPVQT